MPGLSIIVASADGQRFYAALETAAAAAALGRSARIFLQGEAAAAWREAVARLGQEPRLVADAGLPDTGFVLDEGRHGS